jgi:hypothetical protein
MSILFVDLMENFLFTKFQLSAKKIRLAVKFNEIFWDFYYLINYLGAILKN